MTPADLLVDPRTGLVKRLVTLPPQPGLPRSYLSVGADVAHTETFASWLADRLAYGAALGDPQSATAAALGEAVERYCGNAVPDDLHYETGTTLARRGRAVLDPAELALYSDRQYATPGFPFTRYTSQLRLTWIGTRDLVTGQDMLVPDQLVHLNTRTPRKPREPAITQVRYAGIAAGPTQDAAILAALLEVIERDAVTLWWQSGAQALPVPLHRCPDLAALLADPTADALTHSLWLLPSTGIAPVVGALVQDRQHDLLAFGSACRDTTPAAATKAVTEALQILTLARELLDPHSNIYRAAELGIAETRTYKPHRPDRRYLDDYRADRHDLHDLGTHAQIYLDPRMHAVTLDRLNPDRLAPLAADAPLPAVAGDLLASCVAALTAQGQRVLTADLTTSDVAATGLHVARVIVPGWYNNAPAAFPYLGGQRLYQQPHARGWIPHPCGEDDLVRDPLPFA